MLIRLVLRWRTTHPEHSGMALLLAVLIAPNFAGAFKDRVTIKRMIQGRGAVWTE